MQEGLIPRAASARFLYCTRSWTLPHLHICTPTGEFCRDIQGRKVFRWFSARWSHLQVWTMLSYLTFVGKIEDCVTTMWSPGFAKTRATKTMRTTESQIPQDVRTEICLSKDHGKMTPVWKWIKRLIVVHMQSAISWWSLGRQLWCRYNWLVLYSPCGVFFAVYWLIFSSPDLHYAVLTD